MDSDPKTAFLKAIEAVDKTEADGIVATEAKAALYETLTVPRMEAVFIGHNSRVELAIFSPDGRYILTGSNDSTARLWDRTGTLITILGGHRDGVKSADFSPDSHRIVTGSEDGTARLWDSDGNFLTALDGHENTLNSVSFSPDGRRIVTASDDGTARLWDSEGQLLEVMTGHDGASEGGQF